jgi:hypothetical protein
MIATTETSLLEVQTQLWKARAQAAEQKSSTGDGRS